MQIITKDWVLDKTVVGFFTFWQFPFTASEIELNYHHQEVNIWVASGVAKRLGKLTKLGNFKKMSDIFGFDGKYTVSNFDICARNSPKINYNTFHRKTYFTLLRELIQGSS